MKNLLEGDISTDCPATALRGKDNLIVILDEEAASLLDEETIKEGKSI